MREVYYYILKHPRFIIEIISLKVLIGILFIIPFGLNFILYTFLLFIVLLLYFICINSAIKTLILLLFNQILVFNIDRKFWFVYTYSNTYHSFHNLSISSNYYHKYNIRDIIINGFQGKVIENIREDIMKINAKKERKKNEKEKEKSEDVKYKENYKKSKYIKL